MADRLSRDHNAGQVVVVCGTNKRMKATLEEYAWPGDESGVSVRVLGFVPNMDEWMAASDLLVTKVQPRYPRYPPSIRNCNRRRVVLSIKCL